MHVQTNPATEYVQTESDKTVLLLDIPLMSDERRHEIAAKRAKSWLIKNGLEPTQQAVDAFHETLWDIYHANGDFSEIMERLMAKIKEESVA